MYIYVYMYSRSRAQGKDIRIRTKPLGDDLRASNDKNTRALRGCPCMWPRLRKAARGILRSWITKLSYMIVLRSYI